MPKINFDKVKTYKPEISKRDLSKNEIHKYVYNTTKWRELRMQKLSNNPLCEKCLEKGIVTLATDVHHIYEISNANSIYEMKSIGFDYNNLMSLCKECHIEIHRNNEIHSDK